MKKLSKILIPMLVLATILISACAGTSALAETFGGSKVAAAPVEFTGVIESINGDQWVINGQAITVDPAVVNDGPFNVGDTVKVEADVQADGGILVTRVEPPSAQVVASETVSTPEASSTPDPSSGGATPDPILVNDDNSNANSNTNTSIDDNSNDNNGNSNDSVDDNGNDDSDHEDENNSNSGGSDDNSGSGGGENSNSGGSN